MGTKGRMVISACGPGGINRIWSKSWKISSLLSIEERGGKRMTWESNLVLTWPLTCGIIYYLWASAGTEGIC